MPRQFMFEWEWRDLHEASFLSDSLLVQVAMSSAGHNVGLCHANACNSENIHVTSIITGVGEVKYFPVI